MLEDAKALSLPLVAKSEINVDNLLKEAEEVTRSLKSALASGYKIEATHTLVVEKVGYLVYSLVKEKAE